jgi:hypothetical protein
MRIKAPAFLTRHMGYETNHAGIMRKRAAQRKRDRLPVTLLTIAFLSIARCSARPAWRKMMR